MGTFGGDQLPLGPGDSGKSSILDAIDLCLGARRTVGFADTDFYGCWRRPKTEPHLKVVPNEN